MADVQPVHVLRGHHAEIQCLCFPSDENLYTGDRNGELRFWDLASCRASYTVRLHDANAGILHLACLPAYDALVSQGRDGCVRLWAASQLGGLDRPQPLCEVRTGSFNFCRCAVWAHAEGAHASAAATRGAAAPAAAAGEGAPEAPRAQATCLGQLRDVLLACASADPADVMLWRPAEAPSAVAHLRQGSGQPKHGMCMALAFLPGHPAPAQPCSSAAPSSHDASANSADGGCGKGAGASGVDRGSGSVSCPTDPRFIVTGYEDGVVALWDLRRTGAPLGSLRVHEEPVMGLDAHPRRAGERGRSAGNQRKATSSSGDQGGGSGMDHEGTGDQPPAYDLISGSADSRISCCVVRPFEPQPLTLSKQLSLREAGTADVRIRPDGRLFAAGCWDGRARLYSLRKKEPLAVLKYHRDQLTALAFSPLSSTLATASRDTTVALWSVYPTASPQAAGR